MVQMIFGFAVKEAGKHSSEKVIKTIGKTVGKVIIIPMAKVYFEEMARKAARNNPDGFFRRNRADQCRKNNGNEYDEQKKYA